MDSMLAELQDIFRDVMDDPSIVLTSDSNASNVKDWDSLTHINLMTAVANHYKIKFKLSELQDLKNVGDLITLLTRKLEATSTDTDTRFALRSSMTHCRGLWCSSCGFQEIALISNLSLPTAPRANSPMQSRVVANCTIFAMPPTLLKRQSRGWKTMECCWYRNPRLP